MALSLHISTPTAPHHQSCQQSLTNIDDFCQWRMRANFAILCTQQRIRQMDTPTREDAVYMEFMQRATSPREYNNTAK